MKNFPIQSYTSLPPLFTLYQRTSNLWRLLVPGYLRLRLRHGQEDAERLTERLGKARLPRPDTPLVWLHASSVGESLSILPLVNLLLREQPMLSVLITTVSVTAARILTQYLPTHAFHQYIPVDQTIYLKRFLNYWHPDLALWVESEFWPNTLLEARKYAPIILVNGRISNKSFQRWIQWPQEAKVLMGIFDLCLGQSVEDCNRLLHLGAQRVEYIGNLKSSALPLPVNLNILASLQKSLAGRQVWLAASTHPGEEILVGRVHKRLSAIFPKLVTIIAPRHPARSASVLSSLSATGLKVSQYSINGTTVQQDTDIYLIDVLGQLGLFFRVAPIVFIGKSLIAHGGHNPLEPARLGCAVLFGPNMENFADIAARMVIAGAAQIVLNETHLSIILMTLMLTRNSYIMGIASQLFASSETQVLSRLLSQLKPYLDRLHTIT